MNQKSKVGFTRINIIVTMIWLVSRSYNFESFQSVEFFLSRQKKLTKILNGNNLRHLISKKKKIWPIHTRCTTQQFSHIFYLIILRFLYNLITQFFLLLLISFTFNMCLINDCDSVRAITWHCTIVFSKEKDDEQNEKKYRFDMNSMNIPI